MGWSLEDEATCRESVATICDAAETQASRDRAWRRLLARLAPHVEGWSRKSQLLRRCGLASEDDARGVLVGVIERLSSRNFQALRSFAARDADAVAPDVAAERDADVLDHVLRFTRDVGADPPARSEPAFSTSRATPFGAWLLAVTRYAAADHVRDRLGWAQDGDRSGTKRALGTGAERLDDVGEPSHRPPLTDYLTLKKLLDEIDAYVRTLPEDQRKALALWLEDHSFEEIAERLGLDGPERARALTRAAQARLRERFRGQWPEVHALHARTA